MAEPPAAPAVPLASPIPGTDLIALGRGGAIVVIVGELWLALAYALIPRHRLTTISALLFVIGLAFIRQELVFIAAVAMLALWACEGRLTRERRLLAFVVLLCVTLALSGVNP